MSQSEGASRTINECHGGVPQVMHVMETEVHIKGRHLAVPSVRIEDRTVITTGRWLKVASARDEELLQGDTVKDPVAFISQLKRSRLKADIFTFAQRVPDTTPKYAYRTECENAAALPITTFSEWFQHGAEYSIRKAVKRAQKLGVITRIAEFNDAFVEAALHIYNEVPVRQGKTFWHYGKSFDTIKAELEDSIDISVFIGAYHHDELIGFMKLAWVGSTGTVTQILSMKKHFDKRPNNALIARAIELCESKGKSWFIYGNFVYYDANSSLTAFKKRIGFQSVPLPRYYIPLTFKGRIALSLRLHRPMIANIPQPVLNRLLKLRSWWAQRRLNSSTSRAALLEQKNEPV